MKYAGSVVGAAPALKMRNADTPTNGSADPYVTAR
nr:MAG TPA: hypothetical protein [Caudoviricetes sp.]